MRPIHGSYLCLLPSESFRLSLCCVILLYMRKEPLVTGEYYHIYNRGVDKRDIVSNLKDIARLKESIKQFNQIKAIGSLEMYH